MRKGAVASVVAWRVPDCLGSHVAPFLGCQLPGGELLDLAHSALLGRLSLAVGSRSDKEGRKAATKWQRRSFSRWETKGGLEHHMGWAQPFHRGAENGRPFSGTGGPKGAPLAKSTSAWGLKATSEKGKSDQRPIGGNYRVGQHSGSLLRRCFTAVKSWRKCILQKQPLYF